MKLAEANLTKIAQLSAENLTKDNFKRSHQIQKLIMLQSIKYQPQEINIKIPKKSIFLFCVTSKIRYLCTPFAENGQNFEISGFVAQLDRALDYESRGCKFESCQGHY